MTDPKQFLGNKNRDFLDVQGQAQKTVFRQKNSLATSTILLMAFGSLGFKPSNTRRGNMTNLQRRQEDVSSSTENGA